MKAHCASAVVMVPPDDFGFNEETAGDNAWQARPSLSQAAVREAARREFDVFASALEAHGIQVMRLEKDPESEVITPDAVFPNNWFSTTSEGTIVIFTAATPSRRSERRPVDLERLLEEYGYDIRSYVYIGKIEESVRVLEGTGSMVFDHVARKAYAGRSSRTHPEAFFEFTRLREHTEAFLFETRDSSDHPIYHTNVMMSIGQGFVVVCTESILPSDRARVLAQLSQDREVIEISMEQMERGFCGNILQLKNGEGEHVIAMSSTAFHAFTGEQRERLAAHGKVLHADLSTIESVGGGSARCMLAEIFLPRV
jgi:hypothetical protein